MHDHTLFHCLQIVRSDIRSQIKLHVNLVTAYGDFNLPRGFVWVNILTSSSLRVVKKGQLIKHTQRIYRIKTFAAKVRRGQWNLPSRLKSTEFDGNLT